MDTKWTKEDRIRAVPRVGDGRRSRRGSDKDDAQCRADRSRFSDQSLDTAFGEADIGHHQSGMSFAHEFSSLGTPFGFPEHSKVVEPK